MDLSGSSLVACAKVLCLTLAPFVAQDGRSRRLSEPFPLVPAQDVVEFAYSPDGARLAYWVHEANGSSTLYSRAADGSGGATALVNLQGQHTAPHFLADGVHVLYAHTEAGGARAFTVPFDGSSAPFDVIGHPVQTAALTPDDARLVYIDDPFTANRFTLFSIPIGGGLPIVLNGDLVAGGDVHEFLLSADSTRAVYAADEVRGAGIYSAPVDQPNSSVPLDTGVLMPQAGFRLAPDSAHVVFRGRVSGFGLFSSPLDGSTPPVLLSHHTGPSFVDVEDDFQVSPDGAWVAWRADRFVDNKLELFSAPIDGSAAPVQLSPAMPDTSDVSAGFRIAPDSARVVWRADAVTKGRFDLYSAPLDGSAAAVPLAIPGAAGEDVNALLLFGPDGSRISFLLGWTGLAQKLYSVRTDGSSSPVLLDDRLSDQAQVSAPEVTLDGTRIVYRRFVADGQELCDTRLDGLTSPVTLAASDHLGQYTLSPDGARVAFVVDQDLDTVDELFARPLDASAPAVQVSQEFASTLPKGNVYSFRAGAERAMFIADEDSSGVTGLFSVPLRTRGPRLRISDTSGGPIDVVEAGKVEFAAGETRAVFRGWISEREWLFSATVDHMSDPIVLNVGTQPYASITSYRISPDGLSAVFLSDLDEDETFELYGAPLTFQTGPVKLSGALVAGGDVLSGYQITPDGARVVYVADRDKDDVFELYSTTGSGAPLKLSGTPPVDRDVQPDLLLSPDGSRVFFRADLDVKGRLELYSVPTDGSSAPVKISGASIAGTNVATGFRVTPDGAYVLFSADLLVNDVYRLFRADSDGAGSPALLSTTNSQYQNVGGILIDPSGTRVVYWAGDYSTEQAIYSVPIAGGTPVQLSDRFNQGYVGDLHYIGEAPGFQITPDGTRVLYLFDPYSTGTSSLNVVPIAGGAPMRLNSSTDGQDALAFLVDPSSQWAIYMTGFSSGYDLHLVALDLSRIPVLVNHEPSNGRVGDDFGFSSDGAAIVYRFDPRADFESDLYASFLDPRPLGAPAPTPTRTVTRTQ